VSQRCKCVFPSFYPSAHPLPLPSERTKIRNQTSLEADPPEFPGSFSCPAFMAGVSPFTFIRPGAFSLGPLVSFVLGPVQYLAGFQAPPLPAGIPAALHALPCRMTSRLPKEQPESTALQRFFEPTSPPPRVCWCRRARPLSNFISPLADVVVNLSGIRHSNLC